VACAEQTVRDLLLSTKKKQNEQIFYNLGSTDPERAKNKCNIWWLKSKVGTDKGPVLRRQKQGSCVSKPK